MMGIPVSRGGAWALVFLEEQRHWHPAAECLCLCLWRYVLVFVLVLVLVVVGFMRFARIMSSYASSSRRHA